VERDRELEEECPGLREGRYSQTSPKDVSYNCVAWAVGDTRNWWYDVSNVKGYYWPPGVPSADTLEGWIRLFEIHSYSETDDPGLEPEYEKVAIYASADGTPQHVARQKGSGVWTSKMGKGIDIEHPTLESLEGELNGRVVKIMKRKCQGGKRVLE